MPTLLFYFSFCFFCTLFSVDSPEIPEVSEEAPEETTEEFLEAIEKNSLVSSTSVNKNDEIKNTESKEEVLSDDEHEIL